MCPGMGKGAPSHLLQIAGTAFAIQTVCYVVSFFSLAIRSMRQRVVLLTPSSLAISCFFFLGLREE